MRLWKGLFLSAALGPLPCEAWGNLAHRTIALLAQKYFTQDALVYTKGLLGSETIDSAAIWADDYKQLPEGRSTGSWHFVDARDHPPSSCSVDYHRDCQPNRTCVIDAIQNMTSRVNDNLLSTQERTMALKFILHLIGDIHCPLHAEAIARGGNDIPVLYAGMETNLHFVWDVSMPHDVANRKEGDDEVEVAKRWADQLYDKSRETPNLWGQEAIPTLMDSIIHSESRDGYIMAWAREANALVCAVALSGGVDAIKHKDLSTSYFDVSAQVIERQIYSAGSRLGAWINLLATNSTAVSGERGELR